MKNINMQLSKYCTLKLIYSGGYIHWFILYFCKCDFFFSYLYISYSLILNVCFKIFVLSKQKKIIISLDGLFV